MSTAISAMEPLVVASGGIADRAIELYSGSAALGASLHPVTAESVSRLVAVFNSYYSNLIEGHDTHPADVLEAMRDPASVKPADRDLIEESLIHIDLQNEISVRLEADSDLDPTSIDFLKWVHGRFYERLPKALRMIEDPSRKEWVEVVGGQLRGRDVMVGRHVPPPHVALPAFLARFHQVYSPSRFHGHDKLMAVAASHHRLAWIHPFLDGNGRVARLFTGAMLKRAGIDGLGLWSVSRGLARGKNSYLASFVRADQGRPGDLDGRGNLSEKGLIEFCTYFLDTCLDQVTYMRTALELDDLLDRLRGYVELRHRKMIPGQRPLKVEAAYLLQEVVTRGEVPRGEAGRIMGMPVRTASDVVSAMVSDGLLVSRSPKGPLHLGIPSSVIGYWFPGLYAAEKRKSFRLSL